eukprot:Protomagalhaensia_sp_Gyna_25__3132@NODE_2868_length_843_cov_93_079602_g2364_i1_p1_GENE_NODE_2868_length_843_cov_93_079602_g2364_i1NODE_2868_length_843_cov_93_079602_g2364_i1_p1_ORF_typecomplete_len170_score7_97_NODE_2868_length_843_cov_93_079602_g2364_i1129638
MYRGTCADGNFQTVQFALQLYWLLCGELCLLAGAMAIGGYDIYATVTDPSHNHGVFGWFCQHPYMVYILLAVSAGVLIRKLHSDWIILSLFAPIVIWAWPDVCRSKPLANLLAIALPWTVGLPAPYFDRFALPKTAALAWVSFFCCFAASTLPDALLRVSTVSSLTSPV